MPVIATPTSPTSLTQDDVRSFLRDFAGQIPNTGSYNIMFDLPEFSDDEIQRAVRFTVARYNVTALPSNTPQDAINPWLLLLGCSSYLMRSEAHRQVRNQVTYQDGDIQPIGLDDKMQAYLALAQEADAQFISQVTHYKSSKNLEEAYGRIGSGYRLVSRHTSGG